MEQNPANSQWQGGFQVDGLADPASPWDSDCVNCPP
jgi:hypothetical protein